MATSIPATSVTPPSTDICARQTRSSFDPRRAATSWRRIDHELVDRAWCATTVQPHPPELVSKRLHNFEFSLVGDFIADQAWVR
jgi:hypothetical protein